MFCLSAERMFTVTEEIMFFVTETSTNGTHLIFWLSSASNEGCPMRKYKAIAE